MSFFSANKRVIFNSRVKKCYPNYWPLQSAHFFLAFLTICGLHGNKTIHLQKQSNYSHNLRLFHRSRSVAPAKRLALMTANTRSIRQKLSKKLPQPILIIVQYSCIITFCNSFWSFFFQCMIQIHHLLLVAICLNSFTRF